MRRNVPRGIFVAGGVLPMLTFLLVGATHAQSAKPDAPPGMEDRGSPFSNSGPGPSTFSGKPAAPVVVAASTTPGEVHGVTRYPNGLPIGGAEVILISGDTNTDRDTVSASDGSFGFKKLKPGEYQLSAKKDGFRLSAVSKIEVANGKIVTADLHLGSSLAVTSTPNEVAILPRRALASNYSVQPASMRIASPPATDEPVLAADAAPANPSQPASPAADKPAAAAKPAASAAEPAIPAAVMDELTSMRRRIDELEAALKARTAADKPAAETPAAPVPLPATATAVVAESPAAPPAQAAEPPKLLPGQMLASGGTPTYFKGDVDLPTHPDNFEPFSYADWTWMNANGRQHDSPWSTKYFTPEFRADVNYIDDFNHPIDDTLGGSTESFRSNEWQLEQLSLGGDIRIGHVRGRILTMFGEFATTTPRNDGSTGRGQWDLRDAYRYISEGWGGYHFDVNHGLNVDAGIFVSYIGLFSYYNFDNWTYQPSYVSSNTPWFFNGLRIQWFPTAKLKIEPWIINGWQSYARYNGNPGFGGQILWRPKPWLSFVFNNYGNGTDTLGNPYATRIHTDDSVEIREYNKPDNFFDMTATTITTDAGCQYGGGLNCFNDKNGGYKDTFLGWMAYQRFQFKHDTYGLTLGGGQMTNPGRYLTLLQPINGADAISGSPYFTENPGDSYIAYDATATFDYMPSQWLTFRWEIGDRHANVPYWTGRNGITPPGGNTGAPASYVCTNGSASGVSDFSVSTGPGSSFALDNRGGAVAASCAAQFGTGWTAWQPDLRKNQVAATFAIMTRF